MKIKSRQEEGVIIFDLAGKLTIGSGDAELREILHQALEEGSLRIVLNLKKLKRVDSSGLGELVSAHASAKTQQGELKLANLQPSVSDVMGTTQLYSVFDIYDSVGEAVGSFN